MSKPIFRITMLPAKQGDALWIEYGKGDRTRRILIDGGPIGAYSALDDRMQALPDGDKGVELLVVSHVDTDHIEGIIRLFAQKRSKWPVEPNDIWFNGWRHIEAAEIRRRAFDEWNKAFDKKAVVVPEDGPLPVVTLADGMTLTLLSPDANKLQKMADKWRADVDKHGLEPGDLDAAWEQLLETAKYHPEEGILGGPKDFSDKLAKQLKTDQSVANGTSIAFLAEYEGKSCLFLADAHADRICQSLRKLIPAGQERLKVDAVKMSHHGSDHNISEELMNLIDAKHFLISTDGSIYKHPDEAAIEAVITWSKRKPTLWFNYRSEYNAGWEEAPADVEKQFASKYPASNDDGIVVDI
jgi:metal-dependent hydrolase (beta-lactamase superfamily II)